MLSDPSSAEEADAVAEAVESLIGDAERQGRLFAKDIARITLRRELAPDQLNAVIRELSQRGIRIKDDTPSASPSGNDTRDSELLDQREIASLARALQASMRLRGQLESYGTQLTDEIRQILHDGDRARERLVSCNRRLVHWVAMDYRHSKVDMEDLVQEGMIGLMRAIEKFDPDLGINFSTYAVWWIRQSITRTIDNTGGLIRIPVHRLEQLRRLRRMGRQLSMEKGRTPTTMELAASLDWTVEFTAFMQELSRLSPVALDAPAIEDGGMPWYELIADDQTPTPEESAIIEDLQRAVGDALEGLNPREQEIIKLRFGIGEDRDHTLEEIGQKFGVTRERIRQIENKALERLKKAPIRKALRALW